MAGGACAVARRPCAGSPAFPAVPLGANENSAFEALDRLKHRHAAAGDSNHGAATSASSGSANGPANGAANGSANAAANGVANGGGHGVSDEVVPTALRSNIPVDQFTVPRLWYELKVRSRYMRSHLGPHSKPVEALG